ncbi:MAG: hypothetical protein E7F60_07815 [Enterobacter hormaechei]|nr:hypothetical protein [Enterobacter hormaechei]
MKLFWWGLGITGAYFLMLCVTILKLNLNVMVSWNEFGDFLAGAFSPVAFLWLVLGFIQQQRELQQNTEALKLQADELKNSVDQYKEMVSIAREQLLADASLIEENKKIREIETKPDISIKRIAWQSKSGMKYTYKIPVYSDEREARNVRIEFPGGFGGYNSFAKDMLKTPITLPEIIIEGVNIPDEVELFISFESIIGKKYKFRYLFSDVLDGVYQKMERLELVPD